MHTLGRLWAFMATGPVGIADGKHNVIIAAARADREATHVVRVQLDNRVCVDVELFGLLGSQLIVGVGKRVICGWFGLGGVRALSGLGHVTL